MCDGEVASVVVAGLWPNKGPLLPQRGAAQQQSMERWSRERFQRVQAGNYCFICWVLKPETGPMCSTAAQVVEQVPEL